MTARLLALIALISWTLTGCGGSTGASQNAVDTSGATSGAGDSGSTDTDPTPLQAGVDYTQLADLSGYDNWVCDNDTILDPDTGRVLQPSVEVADNPGSLRRRVTSNSIPDHLVGDFPNVGNP
ncbi:MAG: hypothetical protein AAGA61_03455, partial [Pseudomonadota bacterium]